MVSLTCYSLYEVRCLERHERVELVVEERDGRLLEIVRGGGVGLGEHFFGDLQVAAEVSSEH